MKNTLINEYSDAIGRIPPAASFINLGGPVLSDISRMSNPQARREIR
jgi:hypothetical protein